MSYTVAQRGLTFWVVYCDSHWTEACVLACEVRWRVQSSTTFGTPFDHYRWRRLPFGPTVSSEIFQTKLFTTVEGLPGIACVHDDVIVYGPRDTAEEAKRITMRTCWSISQDVTKEISISAGTSLSAATVRFHSWGMSYLRKDSSLIPTKFKLCLKYLPLLTSRGWSASTGL